MQDISVRDVSTNGGIGCDPLSTTQTNLEDERAYKDVSSISKQRASASGLWLSVNEKTTGTWKQRTSASGVWLGVNEKTTDAWKQRTTQPHTLVVAVDDHESSTVDTNGSGASSSGGSISSISSNDTTGATAGNSCSKKRARPTGSEQPPLSSLAALLKKVKTEKDVLTKERDDAKAHAEMLDEMVPPLEAHLVTN